MSAASDFVSFRHYCLRQSKQAASWQDMLGQAGDYVAKNPWAQGAIGGGLAGGLTGLLPGQSIARNAAIGAGLGGAAGGAYQWLNSPLQQGNPQAGKDVQPGGKNFMGPPDGTSLQPDGKDFTGPPAPVTGEPGSDIRSLPGSDSGAASKAFGGPAKDDGEGFKAGPTPVKSPIPSGDPGHIPGAMPSPKKPEVVDQLGLPSLSSPKPTSADAVHALKLQGGTIAADNRSNLAALKTLSAKLGLGQPLSTTQQLFMDPAKKQINNQLLGLFNQQSVPAPTPEELAHAEKVLGYAGAPGRAMEAGANAVENVGNTVGEGWQSAKNFGNNTWDGVREAAGAPGRALDARRAEESARSAEEAATLRQIQEILSKMQGQ